MKTTERCGGCVQQYLTEKKLTVHTGEFYFIRGGDVQAIQSDRSLLETEQLPEEEILRLARASLKPESCLQAKPSIDHLFGWSRF